MSLIWALFKLCSLPITWSVSLTVFVAFCINVFDGAGDIGLSVLLFQNGNYSAGAVILAIDYFAIFLTVPQCIMMTVNTDKSVKRMSVECLVLFFLHPFAPSITMILWLVARLVDKQEYEKHYHSLTKLTVTITSTFEAPLQVIATTWLALTGRIETPWTSEAELCDAFAL